MPKVKIIKPGKSYYDTLYLKLDQTTPQRVINDAPHFDGGIKIKAGQKLYFDSD